MNVLCDEESEKSKKIAKYCQNHTKHSLQGLVNLCSKLSEKQPLKSSNFIPLVKYSGQLYLIESIQLGFQANQFIF